MMVSDQEKPVQKESSVDDSSSASEADQEANSDVRHLQRLYDVMVKEGLDALELKDDQLRIRLSRRQAGVPTQHSAANQAMPAPVAASNSEPSTEITDAENLISTPLAGVFYRASSPTSVPFVKEGDVVDSGQTLCIVEAMKVMNEIKAERRCRIVKIVAENSRPISAGQPLFLTEPAS
jgi:acetyl-CoA carboxylase biotin carboxyl carrier protein